MAGTDSVQILGLFVGLGMVLLALTGYNTMNAELPASIPANWLTGTISDARLSSDVMIFDDYTNANANLDINSFLVNYLKLDSGMNEIDANLKYAGFMCNEFYCYDKTELHYIGRDSFNGSNELIVLDENSQLFLEDLELSDFYYYLLDDNSDFNLGDFNRTILGDNNVMLALDFYDFNFASDWSEGPNATINDANTFTTTGSGTIYTNTAKYEIGTTYRIRIAGTKTTTQLRLYNAQSSVNNMTDYITDNTFDVTFDYEAVNEYQTLYVPDAGEVNITSFERVPIENNGNYISKVFDNDENTIWRSIYFTSVLGESEYLPPYSHTNKDINMSGNLLYSTTDINTYDLTKLISPDLSGNDNDIDLPKLGNSIELGGRLPSSDCVLNNCVRFGDPTGYMLDTETPISPAVKDNFSISFWIKLRENLSSGQRILGSYSVGGIILKINSDERLQVALGDESTSTGFNNITNPLTIDSWEYITLVIDRDNNNLIGYKGLSNDYNVDISAITGDVNFSSDLYIGKYSSDIAIADYDEFHYYSDRILNLEKITESYYADINGNILIDGNMEAADTSAYTANNDAVLTKSTADPYEGTQALRIAYDGTANPGALQSVIESGKRYHITGRGRGDGTAKPQIYFDSISHFVGTTSTDWQYFDFTYTSGATTNLGLIGNSAGVGNWVEFDDIVIMPHDSNITVDYNFDENDGYVVYNSVNDSDTAELNGLGRPEFNEGPLDLTYSYYFDGQDDFIKATELTGSDFDANQKTISFWAKNLGEDSYPLGFYQGGASYDGLMRFTTNSISIYSADVDGPEALVVSTSIHRDGQWHMYTYSISDENMILYVDGDYLGHHEPDKALIPSTSAQFIIGARGVTSPLSGYYEGYMSEVVAWKRILSGNEIKEIHNSYEDGNRFYYTDVQLQVRTCGDENCDTNVSVWKGSDGTSSTYFDTNIEYDISSLGIQSNYLQFIAYLSSDENYRTPYLMSSRIGFTDGMKRLYVSGDLLSEEDGIFNLGSASYRFRDVYAVNGTIQTSDARQKEEIKSIVGALNIVDLMIPISYEWINEDIDNKIHFGFSAQDLYSSGSNALINSVYSEDEEPKGVYYYNFVPILSKASIELVDKTDDIKSGLCKKNNKYSFCKKQKV